MSEPSNPPPARSSTGQPGLQDASTVPPSLEPEPETLAPRKDLPGPATISYGAARLGELSPKLPAPFGRYRLLKLLGRGGMGAVYLAHDSQLDRAVALKIPNFTAEEPTPLLERFYREARAAATLTHPNLCPVYDVGQHDGVPYLTMAYIAGEPLSAYLRGGSPWPAAQAAALVRILATALQQAHQRGVVHRDLKPANIMLTPRKQPVIMDFGLARRSRGRDEARLTLCGTLIGTPAYMPPEQVNGQIEAMGPTCDIYSLGVILYELLTGRVPFQGELAALLAQIVLDEPPPPRQFRPDLDPALEAICLKALAKKPADRYPSMSAFAVALTDYLRGTGKVPERVPARTGEPGKPPTGEHELASLFAELARQPAEPAARKLPRRRSPVSWVAWAACGGTAAALLVGTLWFALGPSSEDGSPPSPDAPPHGSQAAARGRPVQGPPQLDARADADDLHLPLPSSSKEPNPPPPGPAAKPQGNPTSQPSVPVTKPAPSPPALPPKPVALPLLGPPARSKGLRVPTTRELEEAKNLIRKGQAAAFTRARFDPGARRALVEKLRQQGLEAKGDPLVRYACLDWGRELAADGFDPWLALRLIDDLALSFDVPRSSLKEKALAAIHRRQVKVAPAANLGAFVSAQTQLVEATLVAAEDSLADPGPRRTDLLLKLAETVGHERFRNKPLLARTRTWANEIHEREQEERAAVQAAQVVRDHPDDEAANLVLGRFVGLQRGQWDQALPYLARAGSEPLAVLARQDLAAAGSAAVRKSRGDAWWRHAETVRGLEQRGCFRRAASWYEQALGPLRGIDRLQVAERVNKIGPVFDQATPLLDRDFAREPPRRALLKDGFESGNEYGRHYLRSPAGWSGRWGWWWFREGEGDYHAHFACQVRARLTGAYSDGWNLYFINKDGTWGFWVRIDSEGTLHVFTGYPPEGSATPGPVIQHPALRKHGQINQLLVVVQGRQVDLWVNDTRLGEPILLDREFPSFVRLLLGLNVRAEPGQQVDFERLTVWPARPSPPSGSLSITAK